MRQMAHHADAYLCFQQHEATRSMSTTPWIGCQSITGLPLAGICLYTRVERGTVRVKCLTQEHNTMSLLDRDQTQTAQSGGKSPNQQASTPPIQEKQKYSQSLMLQTPESVKQKLAQTSRCNTLQCSFLFLKLKSGLSGIKGEGLGGQPSPLWKSKQKTILRKL